MIVYLYVTLNNEVSPYDSFSMKMIGAIVSLIMTAFEVLPPFCDQNCQVFKVTDIFLKIPYLV